MNNHRTVKPLVAAILIALSVSGVARAEASIQEEVKISGARSITPQDEATISSAAIKVLRHVASARGALSGDKPDVERARADLDQADKLIDIIHAALPTTEVKDRIWIARKHLEYEDTQEVLPDLIPIYSSLDELVDYLPTAQARKHLDEAKQALTEGDKAAANDQLEAVDDALLYVEADLPLKATRSLVGEARAALDKADTKGADEALKAAEDNVVFVSFSFDSPLTQAKAALWRAGQDYRLGDIDYAKADLNAAVGHLEKAAESQDEVIRNAAAKLVTEVRDLHETLGGTTDGGYTARLGSTWQRVKALSERSAEYLSTGWQRLRKDLIEAKLQLAYARIDHFYAHDDDAAKVELAEARGYLNAAADKSEGETHSAVVNAGHLFDRLDADLKSDAKLIGAVFDQAEAQLATIIHQL